MRKKIIAAALISAVLTVSLTACSGATSESVSSDKPGENIEGEATSITAKQTESAAGGVSVPENSATETVQSETTPAQSQVEEVREYLKLDITGQGIIRNGSWYFTADNNGITENYLYNFADKKLVKFDIENGYRVGDISGYKVLLLIESDMAPVGDTGRLIDAASNSVLTEDLLFIRNYSNWFFANDTLLVGKHEASFSSVTDSFGLMNSSGEWIYPLSPATPLNDNNFFVLADHYCNVINLGNGYVQVGSSCYSLKTNSLAKGGSGEFILLEGDQGYWISASTLCKCDFNTNETTELARGAYPIADAKNKIVYMGNGFYDLKTNKLTELTNILGEPTAFYNGYLFNTKIIGADNNYYFGAYNLKGEFAFEPIRADSGPYVKIVPVGDKVIITVDSPDPAFYIFDTANNTLSTVEMDDSYSRGFIAGDDDTVIVEKIVDRHDRTYALADIDDLTKTYSPFDS